MGTPEQYAYRKEVGLCVNCGREPARPGRVCCQICAEMFRVKRQALMERRRTTGLCPMCGAPLRLGDGKTCKKCIHYQVVSRQQRRARADE